MRAPNRYQLPKELQPETSYEYGCGDSHGSYVPYDGEVYQRNRNVRVSSDRVVKDEYGFLTRVRGSTRIAGRRWDILEKF